MDIRSPSWWSALFGALGFGSGLVVRARRAGEFKARILHHLDEAEPAMGEFRKLQTDVAVHSETMKGTNEKLDLVVAALGETNRRLDTIADILMQNGRHT